MANSRDQPGGIVAFEGHMENVTTQLRLLPTSPHILILPGVQCYMHEDISDNNFVLADYIRNIQLALNDRTKAARSFLEQSGIDDKRLVFMNGGTANAQALCVRAIMRHHTDGDHLQAQKLLDHMVRGGFHGLQKQWDSWKNQTLQATEPTPRDLLVSLHDDARSDDEGEDPITKAMRAADALDRETESLQQSNELDLTLISRPRCNSLPLYGYTDSLNDAAPFFVFGAQSRILKDGSMAHKASMSTLLSPTTPSFAVTHYDDSIKEWSKPHIADTVSPSCVGESYDPKAAAMWSPATVEYFTPHTATFNPRSPDTSIFRDSSLMEVSSLGGLQPPPAHRRIRSLDRIFPMTPKYGDVLIDDLASTPTAVATPTPRAETFGYGSHKSIVSMITDDVEEGSAQQDVIIKAARTITMRPSRGTIILDPVPKDRRSRPIQSVYVDKGTDAEAVPVPGQPFEPLFSMDEDLVVHIKDDVPDPVLDRAIQALRDGVYPTSEPVAPNSESMKPIVNETTADQQHSNPDLQQTHVPATMASPPLDSDEYDPFAYTQSPRAMSTMTTTKVETLVRRPPTPDKTPPPSILEKQDTFRELNVTAKQTAVAVQNSLRSVLNDRFPPDLQGYHQFQFSLMPELEGLWEPIFRQAEPGSPRKDNRHVDQIIAIGSQRDVKREYSTSIMSQLESLGKKSSGLSRSGRLDFRYVLAAVIQTFTAQPLANQTTNNPFNNPYLLATLLIPQLETYLALHSEVRYLILEYPPEHLGTVLAMQNLVGVEVMKVSQIIDSKSSETLPFTHIRGVSIGSQAGSSRDSASARYSRPPHPAFMAEAHLSKANFLLTASASEAEIATFISTVTKILSEVSDFYIPEPKAKKPSPRKAKPAPLQSTFSAFPKPSVGIPATPTTPGFAGASRAGSPAVSIRAPSVSDTLRTVKTARSKHHSHNRNKSKTSRRGNDAASMYTFDPAEDSDYDFEEKRLMPLFLQKPKKRKGDSRKALKFLGLA